MTFDDPNLVSSAGLVPVLALAQPAGLRDLVDQQLSVPTDKGANAGLKVASLAAGMVAGADSIDAARVCQAPIRDWPGRDTPGEIRESLTRVVPGAHTRMKSIVRGIE